ncbi:MAG: hypothetical protein ACJAS9_003410 [Polaribacter sp.]|jgi:hypothetical protein
MNKYLYSWFFILSTVHSSLLIAESMVVSDSLTRQQVIAFKSTTLKIALLNAEYPELAEYSQQFDFNKSKQVIAFLKKSNAYSKIEIILQDTEIEDLNQVFKISQKVMGGLYFLNRNKDDTNQSVSQFETIRNVLLDNLARLKKQSDSSIGNNSEFLIKETEVQLALLDKQLIIVKQSLESLTDADKLFLEENSEWFKKQF